MVREYEPPTPEILQWVAHRVHPRARVTTFACLPGGITADMDRITVDAPTGVEEVVLRRWPSEDWAEGLVSREASALAAVRGRVPAPQLIAMDEDGAETGVRCSLTSALTGQPDLAPTDMHSWLGQLAPTQAAIHAVPDHPQARWDGWYDDGAATSLPDRYGVRYRPLDWLADRGLTGEGVSDVGGEEVHGVPGRGCRGLGRSAPWFWGRRGGRGGDRRREGVRRHPERW